VAPSGKKAATSPQDWLSSPPERDRSGDAKKKAPKADASRSRGPKQPRKQENGSRAPDATVWLIDSGDETD
jgi:hypothetical protein